MKIFVKAKPRAREDALEKISENTFVAKVREAPKEGRANQAIIKLLSEYFKTPRQNIRTSAFGKKPCFSPRRKIKIISGETSKIKMIEIN